MKEKSISVIGGMFGLELEVAATNRVPAFLTEPSQFLATARSAFTLLTGILRPEQVWLPSYVCGVVLGAFPAGMTQVRFYGVDRNLRLYNDDWLRNVRPGDLTVFIDYFGFSAWDEQGAEARRRGAWVVEDACQAMLNDRFCKHAHFVVFSPRKFVGVPDGGILQARGGAILPDCDLPPVPGEWWLEALAAAQLRAEFDRHGGDRKWLKLFQKNDALAPIEPIAMSDLSMLVLRHCIDYDRAASRRCENYKMLASELEHLALFPDLSPGVVPLGFPIRLRERDRIRGALFSAEIYPPVHWPIAGFVPVEFSASHQLSEEIMTLPCDQRYTNADMRRMVDCLKAMNPKPAIPA